LPNTVPEDPNTVEPAHQEPLSPSPSENIVPSMYTVKRCLSHMTLLFVHTLTIKITTYSVNGKIYVIL